MIRKLVITTFDNLIINTIIEDGRAAEIHCYRTDDSEAVKVGDIYIGKVKKIAANINAAFIEIAPGVECYYSLESNRNPYFTNKCGKKPFCIGDELLVQIEREAVKTKVPTVTSNLNFTGKYMILTTEKRRLGVSSKLGKKKQEEFKSWFVDESFANGGFIVRTNAKNSEKETIVQEKQRLEEQWLHLQKIANTRKVFSLLKKSPSEYLLDLQNIYQDELEAILVEDLKLFEEVRTYLTQYQPEDVKKLIHYQDNMLPLHKLYAIENILTECRHEKVWMKSGAYLVIQPTEALTVIDVNSGKCVLKKHTEDAFFKINVEAAKEAARQIRLRNLSGIILIDFINMKEERLLDSLIEILKGELKKDPVITSLIDVTKLQLVEITRKKVRKPFHEIFTKS